MSFILSIRSAHKTKQGVTRRGKFLLRGFSIIFKVLYHIIYIYILSYTYGYVYVAYDEGKREDIIYIITIIEKQSIDSARRYKPTVRFYRDGYHGDNVVVVVALVGTRM